MASEYRKKAFPAVIYTALILCAVMIAGRLVKSTIIDKMNPDTRDATEMCRDYLSYRGRQFPKQTGAITDEKVQACVEETTCMMKLMQFWESDPPVKPEPPKMEGEGLRARFKFERRKRNYPAALRLFPIREKLWKGNNESRGDFVFLAGKKGSTTEENQKQAAKYIYLDNLHGYALQFRYDLASGMLRQLKDHKYWKEATSWYWRDYNAFKKDQSKPEGKTDKQWEDEVFKEWVDDFLQEPLACPRKVDGSCIQTWDGTTSKEDADQGRDCLLIRPLAEAVTRANQKLFDKKKTQIQPLVCYRSNLHQTVAFVQNNGIGCSLEGERSGLSAPGNSHHGLGMAMDLASWKHAELFLATEVGMSCDFIKGDEGHCSFGEAGPHGRVLRKQIVLVAKAKGGDIIDIGKKAKELWQNRQ